MSLSRQIVERFIRQVINEVEDDPFDPFGRKKTQTKTRTMSDVDRSVEDLFSDQDLDDLFAQTAVTPAKPAGAPAQGPRARGAPGAPPVRGTTKLADMSGITDKDIMDMLSSTETPVGFDFESEFERGVAQGPVRAPQRGRRPDGRPAPGFGQGITPDDDEGLEDPPPPPQKYFPVYDIAGKLTRKQVAEEVEKVLMAEFVSPAMALGARVLPQVWMELSRLMRADMRGFIAGFQVALNSIRETENEWFAKLLGFMPAAPPPVNVPAEVKATADRIRKVLDVYYDAVLREASKNSDNLIAELQSVEARTDRQTFELGFFDAMSKTRDVEDQAFAQFMGGPARLR